MPLIPREFFKKRLKLSRYKKYYPYAGVVLLVATTGVFLYFRSGDNNLGFGPSNETSRIPASWVLKYFGTRDINDKLVGGELGDPDNDVLSNWLEYLYGTDPTKEDTDGDGDIDSFEVAFGRNPLGEGNMRLTREAEDYIRGYIESNQDLSEFSQKNILVQVQGLFEPSRAVVLDLPADSELIITKQNTVPAFEKYFEDVTSLTLTDQYEFENIASRLFEDLSAQEINFYIQKLQATADLLKKTPVPSEIVNIHKLKIAGLRAGIRMFELARDGYQGDQTSDQFWADVFYQIVAAQQAGSLELASWKELGKKINDMGGFGQ